MAVDKKISELASGAPAQAGDEYVVARSGANYKLTLTNIAASMPPIGATTPNTGAFTTVDATTGNITTVNATTVDATNVEVTNVKAKDGTAAIVISDTSGNVGIGGTASAEVKVHALGTYPTSGNVTQGFRASGTVPSGSTTAARGYVSVLSTEAASFTVANLAQFYANQGTIGATSSITNQYGFYAESGLTGATNNYGFYSNIASGSGRYNFYAAGTADSYFAGNVGIGTASPSQKLDINGNGIVSNLGNSLYIYNSQFGLGTPNSDGLQLFYGDADKLRIGTRTGAGVFSEKVRIDSSGNVGIGGTADAFTKVRVAGTLPTGSNTSAGFYTSGTVPSGSTSDYLGFWSTSSTQATSFTLSNASHFFTSGISIGAGSTVTNQFGFRVSSGLTQATNNYGFYSDIASGSNRWNFYAAGTANNYFAGDVFIGTTSTAGSVNVPIYVAGGGETWQLGPDAAGNFIVYNDNDTGVYVLNGGTSWTANSDERIKTALKPIENAASKVSTLRAVTGRYIKDDESVSRAFLIAQDVQKVLPEAVSIQNDEQGTLGVAYTDVIPLLVAAIKELKAELDALKA